ncbi:glycoside hydrolase family 36 protein [Paenibacillus roseipurpureus]|uniref:Alpha-galactosidase n=1 Tax=Paenibacillus roseopurpureus TaxID=2918901 RepID=A0AA96LNC9_9BACL|nr:alpha-galactosidase [Paenibacillus sp. MBLB1832]WNR42898.1 alpha-galactosidase [Paenibacillus sp. MBLB1832]
MSTMTAQLLTIEENGLVVVYEVDEQQDVRLLHFAAEAFDPSGVPDKHRPRCRALQLHITGENQNDHHGSKHTGTMPGGRLTYAGHRDVRNEAGRKFEMDLRSDGVEVTLHLQFYTGASVVRSWTEVLNTGNVPRGLEYVTSFAFTGFGNNGVVPWDRKCRLYIPHNTWVGELQWRSYTLPELGLSRTSPFSTKPLAYQSTGSWSSSVYLPLGVLTDEETGSSLFWQIEHNGSWHWEIGDGAEGFDAGVKESLLYVQLSGPTETENHWWKRLEPGERFVSVPVSVGSVRGSYEEAFRQLTLYRRAIRRPNEDNEKLPIIFNDYMNCLFGDPTTEKLLPLIDAAAEAGCEYFCIDAGWYADGEWWDGVGEWLPSLQRFPGGIREPLDRIRSKGMVPGLWLEIEVMGIQCPMVKRVSKDWFFQRHGVPIIDRGRYQLDFRNPEVIAHADQVIDRLVNEYGVGYIKMDYNINAGIGTERDANSFGDGLLAHNRAYLAWLDRIFAAYPTLVIENCGSGGMRMDYALLQRHSVQSTSDQCDYRVFSAIAAASPTAVTPEQAAVWSYPLLDGDREETIFNVVNSVLLRVHQSGHLGRLSEERKELIREGLQVYKMIRNDIRQGLPFWPLGLPAYEDGWISMGLTCGAKTYVAIWRLDSSTETILLPIRAGGMKAPAVRVLYPSHHDAAYSWNEGGASLSVKLPNPFTARLFELDWS